MALKSFNPTTPSQRQLVIVDRASLYKGKPVKALTQGLSSKGGRNNQGRITVRFQGGGHKRPTVWLTSSVASSTLKAPLNVWNTTPTAPRSSRWLRIPTANRLTFSRHSVSLPVTR